MSKEIETAYRVDTRYLPDLDNLPYKDIEQVYFTPAEPDPQYPETAEAEWRVRTLTSMNGNTELSTAIKFGNKSVGSRIEIESVLPVGAFGTDPASRERYASAVVRKRRYDLGDSFVLDVFGPEYHGNLVLAEKEFKTSEEQTAWQAPDWCRADQDIPSNRQLAVPLRSEKSQSSSQDRRILTTNEVRALLQNRHDIDVGSVVTVSGMSGSGKSTLAEQLARDLDAPVIETDHLHIGATRLQELGGEINHDLPHAYDYAYAGRIATTLALGQSARMPRYDYEQAEPTGEEITLEPSTTRNVVVDGLYASRISLLGECDNTELCHVLMDTPLYVSVLRRIMRDTALVSEVCQRTVRFSPQESLCYMASVAIPTYLQNEDRSSFDFIVR